MRLLDQIEDVISDHHKFLLPLSEIFLSESHQLLNVLRKEVWLHSINDIEQELLVDILILSYIRQKSSYDSILKSMFDQCPG